MIQYNKYIIKSHVMYSVARTAAEEASWPVITLYKAHSCWPLGCAGAGAAGAHADLRVCVKRSYRNCRKANSRLCLTNNLVQVVPDFYGISILWSARWNKIQCRRANSGLGSSASTKHNERICYCSLTFLSEQSRHILNEIPWQPARHDPQMTVRAWLGK